MMEIMHTMTEGTHKTIFHLTPLHLTPNQVNQTIVSLTRQLRTIAFSTKEVMEVAFLVKTRQASQLSAGSLDKALLLTA